MPLDRFFTTTTTVLLILLCVGVVPAPATAQTPAPPPQYFSAQTQTFRTSNNNPITQAETVAVVQQGMCAYLLGIPSTSATCSSWSDFAENSTYEFCTNAGQQCDWTVIWSYQGDNETNLADATVSAIDTDLTNLLTYFNNSIIVNVVVGTNMPQPQQQIQLITGFIITVTVSYLGFSIVLFVTFCVVQHYYVNRK